MKTNGGWDLVLRDGIGSIPPAVPVGKVSWAAPSKRMNGVTCVFIPSFLDKFIWMDVLREGHGEGEEKSREF